MERLLETVQREGIYLKYDHLDYEERKLYGLYFYDRNRDKSFIVLDVTLDFHPILHRCVLAEELGHYFTVPRSKFTKPFASYGDRIQLSRDERRAMTWAAQFLISDEKLNEALAQQWNSIKELADYLGVTTEIAAIRLQIRRRCA
ncbi:ImmA/IrrE family metallo-endopeptidase [Alicyclobacillus sp.]|uniref:ImmA/IrrE family metallo-endopeptidase n=1 Tax=Alicyclobacillus sp. TaxID=61169 RepID=UPI0025BC5F83|nr:ImmA/IrrE family metallo-endopeptidase [Alicyclobacillus sp.]MCL6516589.1 ImmA/IrrE family metallo-endopeptidase [Alicyclobacillus sp.]